MFDTSEIAILLKLVQQEQTRCRRHKHGTSRRIWEERLKQLAHIELKLVESFKALTPV